MIPLVLMSLMSSPSWGLTIDDLVEREGVYFQKFTDVPFTGEIKEGLQRGSFKNGKRERGWEFYYDNGQLFSKGNYENSKKEGFWKSYKVDGTVWYWVTGTYKNDLLVGN